MTMDDILRDQMGIVLDLVLNYNASTQQKEINEILVGLCPEAQKWYHSIRKEDEEISCDYTILNV